MTRSSREIPSNSTFDKVITKLFDERVMPITGCISGVCDHDGMTGRNKLRTGGVKTMVCRGPIPSRKDDFWWQTVKILERETGGLEKREGPSCDI